MRIRQHAYLAIESDDLSADAITTRLGAAPDRVRVKGSRREEPTAIPSTNAWVAEAKTTGRADEMVAKLVRRVHCFAEPVRVLVQREEATAVLQVVRYLDAEDGEEDERPNPVQIGDLLLEKMPGQHHLLGFHLDSETLRFVAETGIDLDFDEYG